MICARGAGARRLCRRVGRGVLLESLLDERAVHRINAHLDDIGSGHLQDPRAAPERTTPIT
eukprot:329760-Prymnesium_polylepis.1